MAQEMIDLVAQTLVKAGSSFRLDQKEAYRKAISKESNNHTKWVMSQVLDNAEVAEKCLCPLCDDTGIPHIYIEIGKNRSVSGAMLEDIREGVRQGLRQLPGRPMAIKGNDNQRIDQSGGLDEDPAALDHAPIILREHEDDDKIRLTVLMLGGGPAIRGITHRIFHKHSVQVVLDEIVERAKTAVSQLGCSPCTLAVGIGRSQYEATALMMDAMAHGNYDQQTEFESEITRRINEAGIGALGLGGDTSVLATFAKVGPQRASGVRVVALRPCCCFEPRRASVEF
ncbi:MAG: fumarate hydratase [Paludibacteraceae bacterium]|nr:fumarate hydratase [Paludibacteraceae bacterium]